MKKILVLFAVLVAHSSFAQISQTIVNKQKFEVSDFPFKGERILMVEKIDARMEENYFVFSKNSREEIQDRLYIEQFTKVNGTWQLKAADEIAEKGIVTSTWNARKSFSDVDKDGKADVIFVYSKHPKGDMDTQLEVVQILFHNYKIYWVSSTTASNYTEDTYSPNFSELPQTLQEFALDFWNKLDKR